MTEGTESGGPSTTERAKRRKPGTGYPVVALPEAAKIIREAGTYGFEHSVSAFARYMGHSTTNSGAFRRRLASFRDWKLIAGRGDTIVFTDTAKTIALPPDSRTERDALQKAFMNCTVFAALFEGVAKGRPVEANRLGAKAVHELGVSPAAVGTFTTSFIDSAIFAGLAELDDGQIVLNEPHSALDGSPDDDNDEPISAPTADARSDATSARARGLHGPPVVHQEWLVPGGAVVFEVRLDRPLPAQLFSQVGSIVQEVESLAARVRDLATDVTEG